MRRSRRSFCDTSHEDDVRRELALTLRARVTWLAAALAALLVGHGFVLAVDIYSAASRSALANTLQRQFMDPLAAVVRPTLGGVDLALAVLGPILAARSFSIEKERRTYGALALAVGSTNRVVARKAVASFLATSLVVLPAGVLLAAFRGVGGHLGAVETAVALSGEVFHLALVAAIGLAAAACTRTFAQAATIGILASLTSWAIDVADGFAALAWLGSASSWSIQQRLAPFQQGIVSVASAAWLATAVVCALAVACVGASFHRTRTKLLRGAVVTGVGLVALTLVGRTRVAFDCTEERRASLPPEVASALRSIPGPIALDVFLDRDDSRRKQLESDVVRKLLLARADIVVRFPLDGDDAVAAGIRDDDYGRIVVRAGAATRETRSTSRRELVTLLLEAAEVAQPGWSQPPYSGYPMVFEGTRRRALLFLAYFLLPAVLAASGLLLTRRRTLR